MEDCQAVQYAMGTVMSHHAFGDNACKCLVAVQAEVIRLESLFSRYIPGSDISRINRSAGIRQEPVSFETFDLLSRSMDYSKHCEGCFDITIGPLVDLWRGAKRLSYPPAERSIQETLPLTGYADLLLDPPNRTIGLARAGQSIDLGSIGKGYAADRVMDVYREYGISSACSNMGGNVVTLGTKPDGSPWQIGIQHPRCGEALIGAVSVNGKSVVTSGDYQHYFKDIHGTRYHHILDPLTGSPADSGLVSVTIVSDSSTAADALSTSVFVAGLTRGIEMLAGYPDAEAICVDRDMRVWITSGTRPDFQPAAGVETNVF